jgi:hypothetical protein
MRLRGYTMTGRALAPLLIGMVALGTMYGGGPAQAGEAYGFSAVVLLPVLAWQTKMLLDAEPDVQRRLAGVALGTRRREITAGLLAAMLAALPVVALALVVPWTLGGISGPRQADDQPLALGIALGLWAHLLLTPPAVALGALASRAVTRTAGNGAGVLALGTVCTIVLGLNGSPAPWLAPPAIATASHAAGGTTAVAIMGVTAWGTLWTAAAVLGYAYLRRRRR